MILQYYSPEEKAPDEKALFLSHHQGVTESDLIAFVYKAGALFSDGSGRNESAGGKHLL